MGLPHFEKTSHFTTNDEPVFPSLFEIAFILPTILQAQGRDPYELLESATSVNFGNLYPAITEAEQRFKFSTRVYLTLPDKTHTEFSIKFNLNMGTPSDNNPNRTRTLYTWNTLKAWYDLIWNNRFGTTHYKNDILGTVIINQHDKKGFVIRRVTYHNVQLKMVGGWDLDWTQAAQIVDGISCDFVADYWTDEYIDNGLVINTPLLVGGY
jgi:hypothetical protein